jgi:threonyl-tRNA synthetase
MSLNEKLQNQRHSLAHLLAAAVQKLYPSAKRTIGPAIDTGFYYDFDFPEPISDADLKKIQKEMKKLLSTFKSFERHEVSADEAKKEFADNPYKLELIEEFAGDGQNLTVYQSGEFRDLCRGGHSDNLSTIDPDSFALSKLAGAYWRGDEKNKMLTRIYGLAFETKQELEDYLTMLAEAEKRDHRKLGKELDLFTFSELVGPGLPLWTPKGTLLRTLLDDYVWELRSARGYQRVEIPHITKKDLYETSGHWDKFKDELFRITTREGHEFAMKPMNCPHHTQIYARKGWSYRELPQRYANTTMCYRDEQTGELNGLSRVRSFTQDDAHVFCRMPQAQEEVIKVWDIVEEFYGKFGFNMRVRLSMRDSEQPEKYLGKPEQWEAAEETLRKIAKERGVETFEGIGEAAFYGPKLDFMAKDSIGREWQVATIQFDFNQPERFDLTCKNEQGESERVVMIHAAIMGSIERFLSIFIEHTAGNFPLWLSPVQFSILPVSDKHNEYAAKVAEELRAQIPGVRVEIDDRSESIGKKIRETTQAKVPYMAIVGDKEIEANSVSVRAQNGDDLGSLSIKEVVTKLSEEIQNRK